MVRNAEQQARYDAHFDEYGVYPFDGLGENDPEPLILTDEQVAQMEKVTLVNSALGYLRKTDWYAMRKADSGEEIPEDVQTKRAQARLDASL